MTTTHTSVFRPRSEHRLDATRVDARRLKRSVLGLACAFLLGAGGLAAPVVAAEPGDDAPAADGERVVVRGAQVIGDAVVPFRFYGDLRDLPSEEPWEPGDAVVINPRRWTGEVDTFFTPASPDPLLARQRHFFEQQLLEQQLLEQQSLAAADRGPISELVEVHSFEGLDFGSQPPDTTGDIGKNYFIQSVNASRIGIYDKVSGAQVATFALDSLGTGGCVSGAGDPIIVYDELAERWMLSEFTFGSDLCVYISMTDDPIAGGWCNYEFTAPQFPDYPKYSVWPDAYVVTSNEGGNVPVYALDRETMKSCGTARAYQRLTAPRLDGLGFQAFTPADVDGPAPPAGSPALLMRHRDTELGNQGPSLPTTDLLELWALDLDWDTPANSTLSQLPDIVLSEFDSNLCPPINVFSCVPQPNTGTRLDPLLEVVMFRLAYRNFGSHETLVGVLQTDIGDFEDHSGERWFEIRKSGGGDWTLYQEGTWSPDAEHRFMGAIAMDQVGNILLGYALSSSSTSPSVRYTGRKATDPLGVMTQGEQTLIAGTGNNSSSRFGDYSQMGVDPVDGCTFWMTIETTEGTSNNTSWIGAVQFSSCLSLFSDGFESADLGAWSSSVP